MTTGDDRRAKRLQDARDIIERIKRAQFELIPARLLTALAPFGLVVEVTKTIDKVFLQICVLRAGATGGHWQARWLGGLA